MYLFFLRCSFEIVVEDWDKWIEEYERKHGSGKGEEIKRNLVSDLGSDKIENDSNNEYNIDKETLKGIEEDLSKVNPHDYRNNCQKCVSAYEARRRGFDVTAKPASIEEQNIFGKMDDKTGWLSVYKNPKVLQVNGQTADEIKNNISQMMSVWGDGSRAIVRVEFLGHGGHVFISEEIGEKTYFIDPQINDSDVERFFDAIIPEKTYIIRVDNLEFTENIKRCCEEVNTDD